jgi:dienelactone hydrolase
LLFEDAQVGTFSVLLLIPEGGEPHPAIVGLHGHGDSKEIFKQKYFGEDLVKEGFVVIMPSFRAIGFHNYFYCCTFIEILW